jgi:hypothetical protein
VHCAEPADVIAAEFLCTALERFADAKVDELLKWQIGFANAHLARLVSGARSLVERFDLLIWRKAYFDPVPGTIVRLFVGG